jgi:hypothetical protein
MRKENLVTLNLQYSSVLDSTVFKTVARITDQLRELIYHRVDKLDVTISNTLGDILYDHPTKLKVTELSYEIFEFSDVELTIEKLNHDIFGYSLVEIPNSEFIYIIKIVCYLDHKI